MADKILRPITDVEIVEQMTENDTVLIEQNGEIKRTKGVVGGGTGGKKYTIRIEQSDGNMNSSINVGYDELSDMIKAGDIPDIILLNLFSGITVGGIHANILTFADEEMAAIVIGFGDMGGMWLYSSDGTIMPLNAEA